MEGIARNCQKDSDFHRCLKQYAVAALGVAGTSALASGQAPADHVQYTPANIFLTEGHSSVIPIDFNHDGITDITLYVFYYTFAFSGHGGFNYTGVFEVPTAGNLAIGGHAVPKGVPLSLGGVFKGSEQRMAFAVRETDSYGSVSNFGGPFHNVTNEYIGVQFQIAGQPHYGWIRISLGCRKGYATAVSAAMPMKPSLARVWKQARCELLARPEPLSRIQLLVPLACLRRDSQGFLIGENPDFPTSTFECSFTESARVSYNLPRIRARLQSKIPMSSPSPPENRDSDQKKTFWLQFARYSQLAFVLPAALVVGWLIGAALDRWLHTSWLYLAGILIGIAAGFTELIRTVTRDTK